MSSNAWPRAWPLSTSSRTKYSHWHTQILVDTEKAQDQIHLLRSRLDKKVPTGSMQRKLLEQESSDKLLMEERLLAAERKNDQLRAKVRRSM